MTTTLFLLSQVITMRLILTCSALFLISSLTGAQDAVGPLAPAGQEITPAGASSVQQGSNAAPDDDASRPKRRGVRDPFEGQTGMSGMMGGGMSTGEGDMMGMEGMEGMMMEGEGPSPDDAFRIGLQRAIKALGKADSQEDKRALQEYVREAFADRYDKMLAGRKQDLDRLKKQIANLETDLDRRAKAKDRVIQLQLQSVQLAAEGLLDLNDLGMPGARAGGFGGGDMEMMGGGFEMGMGN